MNKVLSTMIKDSILEDCKILNKKGYLNYMHIFKNKDVRFIGIPSKNKEPFKLDKKSNELTLDGTSYKWIGFFKITDDSKINLKRINKLIS